PLGVRTRIQHAISIMRVISTATRNSSIIPSGLWRSGISRHVKNSPTTMDMRSMMSPPSPAIAARIIVVGISLVPNIGTVSSRQRFGNVRPSVQPTAEVSDTHQDVVQHLHENSGGRVGMHRRFYYVRTFGRESGSRHQRRLRDRESHSPDVCT